MAATESLRQPARLATLLILLLTSLTARAAVLPEDRADLLYHQYDGGGMTIDGPSLLVRKSVSEDLSVSANYYVDQVSSASIDVITSASPYSEERTEYSLNADYLLNKTILSGGITQSSENDYDASTYFFGISQDFFGDLSTLALSYAYGADDVYNVEDTAFSEDARRQNYQISWTQVMTRNLLMAFHYNVITDEGYLNNPYRSVRYLTDTGGTGTAPELYPQTRTSHAAALRGKYYLPYRAAFSFEYRRFQDTWEIGAYDLAFGYTHPIREHWTLDVSCRYYKQNEAEFYSDLLPRANYQTYQARDKELSAFDSNTWGAAIRYEFKPRWGWTAWVDKASASLAVDLMQFDYANFRDLRVPVATPGTEPLYQFDATVTRLFLSAWF